MSGLIEDYKGNQLLDLVELNGDPPLADEMVFALAAIFYKKQPVLVFNNMRQYWEIPGGAIDQGESPLEAAHRELLEESGQEVAELTLFAKLKCKFVGQTNAAWGVLFVGRIEELVKFEPTDEIAQVTIWDGATNIGEISEIDRHLLDFISDQSSAVGG